MDFSLNILTHALQLVSVFFSVFLCFNCCSKDRFLKFLTILLFLIVIVENLGLVLNSLNHLNWHVYHIYSFFEYNLITLMYLSVVKNMRSKQVIKSLIVVLNIFYFLTYIFTSFQYWVTPMGSFVVSIYLFLYLNELLQANTVINYTKELPFWVTVGFFIFYLPSIPFFSMLKNMKDRSLFFVLEILVVLMNVFISIGLIIKLLENKKVNKNNIEIDNY